MPQGLIINAQRNSYSVKAETGVFECSLRGKLLKEEKGENKVTVVGDNVTFEIIDGDRGIITEILPRKSKFSRKAVGGREEQLIAANVDQVIIVCSVKDPPYRLGGIDRYIAAAVSGNVEPVICFNKIDLIDPSEIESDRDYYARNGYKTICTSTFNSSGMEELKAVLKDKVSVFSGSSGVGKSTLVNILKDDYITRTGTTGEKNHKGKHTTTSSQVYELDFGGMIIDTPGMREFALHNAEKGVESLFSVIEETAENCKFRNCSHVHEPKCAVKEALEAGLIDERTFKSFLKLKPVKR